MNDNVENDPRLHAIPDIHGHAKGEHKAFADERPIPLSARMLFLWFYHACRRGWPRFLMVTDHMNYLTFEDPAAINLVRRALKLAQAGDLYGAAETASVEVGHAAVVSEGLRRGMRYSIGAEVDNDPRSRPDAQNIVDAMKPDGMIRSVHFLTIDHPTHGPNWNWPFDNPEFADVFELIGTAKTWEVYMATLLDAIERLPGNIVGHFYVPALFGHWPDDETLGAYEDALVDACEARGMAVEFNTRFLYRDHPDDEKSRYLAAHRRLLAKCKAKNVGVAVGSDAHSPKDQGGAFATILALLDECEINELVFPIGGRLARVALRVERKVEPLPEPALPPAEERRVSRKPPRPEPAAEPVAAAPAAVAEAGDEGSAPAAKAKTRPKRSRAKSETVQAAASEAFVASDVVEAQLSAAAPLEDTAKGTTVAAAEATPVAAAEATPVAAAEATSMAAAEAAAEAAPGATASPMPEPSTNGRLKGNGDRAPAAPQPRDSAAAPDAPSRAEQPIPAAGQASSVAAEAVESGDEPGRAHEAHPVVPELPAAAGSDPSVTRSAEDDEPSHSPAAAALANAPTAVDEATAAKPVAAAAEPAVATAEPAAATTEPAASTAQPVASKAEAVAGTAELVASTAELVASTAEPVASTAEPAAATAEPVAATAEPAASTTAPGRRPKRAAAAKRQQGADRGVAVEAAAEPPIAVIAEETVAGDAIEELVTGAEFTPIVVVADEPEPVAAEQSAAAQAAAEQAAMERSHDIAGDADASLPESGSEAVVTVFEPGAAEAPAVRPGHREPEKPRKRVTHHAPAADASRSTAAVRERSLAEPANEPVAESGAVHARERATPASRTAAPAIRKSRPKAAPAAKAKPASAKAKPAAKGAKKSAARTAKPAASAKKPVAKKSAAKKTAAAKVPLKKAGAKKSPAKKTAAKKAAVRSTGAKKSAAKKSAAKKASPKKPAQRRR